MPDNDNWHWFNDAEDGDVTLTHVTDSDIIAVGDSYDDLRINVLTQAYVDLRIAYHNLTDGGADLP
jgi:hypothetical protein